MLAYAATSTAAPDVDRRAGTTHTIQQQQCPNT
jgi:hypothetical protein